MRILTTGPRAAASIDATSHHSDPGQSAGRTKNINSSRSKGLMWRLCTDHVPINVATTFSSSDAHTRSQNTDRHTRTDAHNAKAPNNAAQSTPERTCCPFSRRLIDGSERSQTNHCPRVGTHADKRESVNRCTHWNFRTKLKSLNGQIPVPNQGLRHITV